MGLVNPNSSDPNKNSDPNKATGDDSALSSEISLYAENQKPFSISNFYDYDSFPESKGFQIISWSNFTRAFDGLDLKCTQEITEICEKHLDKLVDLRPYMIENPEICSKFDTLPRIVARFMNMHLRHLIVVNPTNDRLEGIITRQDLFLYMAL